MLDQLPESDTWLSLGEAARRLGVHPTTLRRWADDGEIPVMLTPGGHRRFAVADLDAFARRRHGIRRATGIEQIWADRALDQTRQVVVAQEQPWLTSIDDDMRQRHRQLGRQLLGLTLQYISEENDGDHLLEEAHRIGREYGKVAMESGVPLRGSLQAALFFRDMLMETALQLPESTRITPEANVRLLRRVTTLINTVHLAIAEVYDAHEDDRLRGT